MAAYSIENIKDTRKASENDEHPVATTNHNSESASSLNTRKTSTSISGRHYSLPQFILKKFSRSRRRMSDTDDISSSTDNQSTVSIPTYFEQYTRSQQHLLFTVNECQLLTKTWSDDFDFLYNLGTNIYVHIFENAPHTRKLFPKLLAYGEKWRESKEFRAQALKFVQVISQAIKNIYHVDRLETILYSVGKAHVRLAVQGFHPDYWNVFHEAMKDSISGHIESLNAVLSQSERQEAVRLWRVMTDFIVKQMRKGYMDGIQQQQKITSKT